MIVLITYPDPRGFKAALEMLGACWTGEVEAQPQVAYNLIEIFAPKKVVMS